MVGEWRMLKFTFHGNQTHRLRDVSGVCIDEAHVFVFMDIFCHLRSELEIERKVNRLGFGKIVIIGFGGWQTQLDRKRPENMPCNSIVFAVGIPIADDQQFFQMTYLSNKLSKQNRPNTRKHILSYLV